MKDADGSYLFLSGQKERHSQVHPKSGKYMSLPGDPPRLFNTSALIEASRFLVVVEGEFDTMAWALAGTPCVGAPGTGSWREYWTPALLGYHVVYLIAEDGPGLTFMDDLASHLPNGKVIQMSNKDSNAILIESGRSSLLERIGK
ncbi:topoisomerase [Streptomyces mirabilis]|uniref:topoisomerase n=1 Tax=Streptomyces mirabilis TaxID=68239 RepID=UPI003658EDE7